MVKKKVYIPRKLWSREHLSYWKEKDKWACAVPRDDSATKQGLSWKKFGLIGRGDSKEAAAKDWESWIRAADVVSDIY